ncbi:hypothetical protein FTX61_14110 [Nitriliruptoraceae bacterium ZYF776]|nr:hypothetical protein [Profundirhabdus halotolerans]
MRPGPPRGDSTTLELTVTAKHAASPGDGVPPVLTARALVVAADATCRALFEPHLDVDEVATLTRVDVGLRAPVPVDATVTVAATVATVTSTGLVCEILARHGGTIVARGSVEHRVVDRGTLTAEIAARQPVAG